MSLLGDVRFEKFTDDSPDPVVTDAVKQLNKQLRVGRPEADEPISDVNNLRRVSTLTPSIVFHDILDEKMLLSTCHSS